MSACDIWCTLVTNHAFLWQMLEYTELFTSQRPLLVALSQITLPLP